MSSDQPAASSAESAAPSGPVVARAGAYYRNSRYILAIVMVGYAIWSLYDGFINWPNENMLAFQHGFDQPPHSHSDIFLNQLLGIVLPILAVALLYWMLRRSRGEFRLDNGRLVVPGHPMMTLDEIESIDRSKWDRKGIAFVTYRLNSGKAGTFRLDDFIYERDPIDAIFKQMETALLTPNAPPPPQVAAIPAAPKPPPPTRLPPRPRMGG